MATVKERKGKNGVTYLIRAYSGYDASGKQIEKTMTWKPSPGMSERQIEKALQGVVIDFERKVNDGIILEGSIRFADFAKRWLSDYAIIQLAPKTIERYKGLLVRINQAIGHVRLDKLQPHHLQELYKNLGEAGIKSGGKAMAKIDLNSLLSEKGITQKSVFEKADVSLMTFKNACQGKKITLASAEAIAKALGMPFNKIFKVVDDKATLSDKTILHHHRLISSILQTAVQWQVIYDNPARRVKPPKVQRKEAHYLEDTEAQRMVELLMQEPIKWRAAILLLLYAGIRRGELCGLGWKDVDFENCLIHIRRSSQYVKGMGIIEKGTKNYSSERVLKLPKDVLVILKEYKQWQLAERLKLGSRWQNQIPVKDGTGSITMQLNDRLFTQLEGLPINPDSVTDWVSNFKERNNLPQFSPHTLRHTNISLMIAAGVPMRNISARAGHAQLSTTQNIYAHAIKTADEKAAELIGDILRPREKSTV